MRPVTSLKSRDRASGDRSGKKTVEANAEKDDELKEAKFEPDQNKSKDKSKQDRGQRQGGDRKAKERGQD